uniref:Ferritin n=1 Tax=Panagrolaimus sp. JU765 TaxID=591449 RepID=A0AC34QQ54_9BILA
MPSENREFMPAVSARQNFDAQVNVYLNHQINNELLASYQYLAMSAYFGRTDVALAGAAAFFKNQSMEETQHAQKLIDYVNDRGGDVEFYGVKKPVSIEWPSLMHAFLDAVELEKFNNKSLLELHKIAGEKNDPDLTNFLEEHYLREQVIEIQQMTRRANQLKRVGAGVGEHIIDQELAKEIRKMAKNNEH